jgi:serine/threonine-protein kinase
VLYECLTGKKAFEGETLSETTAAILKSDPDWALLPAETPPPVRSVLRQCLQKDPGLRLHDIADFRVEMRAEIGIHAEAVSTLRRLSLRWALVMAAAALAGGILIGRAVRRPPQPAASISRVASIIKLEPGYCLSGMFGGGRANPYGYDHPTRTGIAVSSDGRFIVYSATKESAGPRDKPRLYLRRMHELEAKPVQGTEGGISPFLSPDDRWIGFWADGKLMKVSTEGGVPVTLCDVPPDFGFSWGSDNRIVFAPGIVVSRWRDVGVRRATPGRCRQEHPAPSPA